jgi:hypothetical protein
MPKFYKPFFPYWTKILGAWGNIKGGLRKLKPWGLDKML